MKCFSIVQSSSIFYKAVVELTVSTTGFLLSISALIISNVTRDLRGVFTCVAYNGIEGKVSRNIHLDVYCELH